MSRIWRIYPSKKIFGIWSWYVNYKQSPKSWQSSPKICNLLALVALMVFMSLNPLTTMMQLSYSLISAQDYCIFHFHCIFYCIFYCIIYCIYLLIFNFFKWQINQVHLACLSNFGIIIGGCLGRLGGGPYLSHISCFWRCVYFWGEIWEGGDLIFLWNFIGYTKSITWSSFLKSQANARQLNCKKIIYRCIYTYM